MSREIDFRSLVIQADPNFTRNSRRVAAYEFRAPGRPSTIPLHPDAEDDAVSYSLGLRVFYSEYQSQGAYAPEVATDEGIKWSGTQITWRGIPLTWSSE